jgi:hypothetical protein
MEKLIVSSNINRNQKSGDFFEDHLADKYMANKK